MEFASSTQNPKKIIRTPNLPIKTKFFLKKQGLVPLKCKGAKNSYAATRRNLQAQPKILKKLSEHQIYQSKPNFFLKNNVSYLKSEKEPKIRLGTTRRNLQALPKIQKKIIGTPNLPIKTTIFTKKSMFSTLKVKRSQKFVWGAVANISEKKIGL
jgi:hypothetical protein